LSQGNAATGGYCSKCYSGLQKTKSEVGTRTKVIEKVEPLVLEVNVASMDDANANAESSTKTPKSSATATPETTVTETPAVTESVPSAVANAPVKKKKKKKTSYKNMMAGMMKEQSRDPADKDSAKEDAIRKVTGGGAFSKIEQI